jgi:hypothetical protein
MERRSGEEVLGGALRAFADHDRKTDIAPLDERFEHRAIRCDDADAPVFLPQRKSLALGDGDLQAIGIELEHRRIADPRIGHQFCARHVGVQKQQRGAAGDAGGGENFFPADFLRSGQRNRDNAETERVRRGVARVLEPVDDIGNVLASNHAVTQHAGDEQHCAGDTDARRQRQSSQQRDPSCSHRAVSALPKRAHQAATRDADMQMGRLTLTRASLPVP